MTYPATVAARTVGAPVISTSRLVLQYSPLYEVFTAARLLLKKKASGTIHTVGWLECVRIDQ